MNQPLNVCPLRVVVDGPTGVVYTDNPVWSNFAPV
jgi:hypothetical protein